jgi:hypothetical protein
MAITYSPIDIRGVAAEPVIEEILFTNDTVGKDLVLFEDDVKSETIFSEATASATLAAWTSGVPSSAGSLTVFDTTITPIKGQFYQEFDPNALRFSRFKRDMKPGAWETMSGEFERLLIGGLYAKQVANAMENEFWNGIKSATKSAIAALTPGTGQAAVGAAEQTQAAALTASLCDGVLAKMLYNNSNASATPGLGTRVKVAGAAITAANIKTEYDKIYTAIPAAALSGSVKPTIYAPRSHKQFIVTANNVNTNYTKPFDADNGYANIYFNGLKIEFVPLPEKVVVCAIKNHLIWCTDLMSDINLLQIEKIAPNREDWFIKVNATIDSHVVNQKFNVLYMG